MPPKIGIAYTSKWEIEQICHSRNITIGPDTLAEFDKIEVIDDIKQAIQTLGYEVCLLGWGEKLISNLQLEKPDLVFNISEGFGGRCREGQVPSLLDMLGIKYVGSDALTLSISLDKNLTKTAVSKVGVPVAKGYLSTEQPIDLPFPVVVKPNHEGSSMGITGKSLAYDESALQESIFTVSNNYKQPALIEEFIDGHEVTVGIVHDRVIGIMSIIPVTNWKLYSREIKDSWETSVDYQLCYELTIDQIELVRRYALQAYNALQCKDFARVDFRLRKDGEPIFLEINPLPGLNKTSSDLVILAKLYDISYTELIERILNSALGR